MAKAIAHALESSRPKTRYLVGLDAKVQARIRPLIPTRLFDRIVARQLNCRAVKAPRALIYCALPIDWSINEGRCVRVAAVQLNSNGDKDRNLAAAERLVRAAAADGAELVALPEKWNLLAGGRGTASPAPSRSTARA